MGVWTDRVSLTHNGHTMLRILLLSAAAVCVLGQWGSMVIDTVHGYRVEYDDRHDIVLMVNDRNCYIVEAQDSDWDTLVKNESELHTATDAIYAQITSASVVIAMTQQQASS